MPHYPSTTSADGYEHHLVRFSTLLDKAKFVDTRATIDSLTRPVLELARKFVRKYPDPGARAHAMHAFVRDAIRYVKDAPIMKGAMGEEFASSEEILDRGYDDCDGKARLLVALARAGGVDARIRPVMPSADRFTHVQTELRWPGSERDPRAARGGWLLGEVIVDGVGLGDDPHVVIRQNQGHVPLAGPRIDEVRTKTSHHRMPPDYAAEIGDAADLAYDACGTIGLYDPDALDNYTEAGSLFGRLKHAASSVAHQIAKHDPLSHVVNAVAHGQNIGHAFGDTVKAMAHDIQKAAPYAQMVASMVPGIGTGVAAAISAGTALAQGKKLSDALIQGIKGALPGGPAAAAAFDSAMALAKGGKVTDALIAAGRDALPDNPQAKAAFNAAIALAHGQALQKTALDAIATQLPGGAEGQAAAQMMRKIGQGVPIAQAAVQVGGEQVAHFAQQALGGHIPGRFQDVRQVARAIIARPDLHNLTRAEIATALGTSIDVAKQGLAAAAGTVARAADPARMGSIPDIARHEGLESKISPTTTFDGAVTQYAQRMSSPSTTPAPSTPAGQGTLAYVRLSEPARLGILGLLPSQHRQRVYDAAGFDSTGTKWTVEKNDTPSSIAQIATGSAARYPELIDANPQKTVVDVYKVTKADGSVQWVNVPSGGPPPSLYGGDTSSPAGKSFASLEAGEPDLNLPQSWQKKSTVDPNAPPLPTPIDPSTLSKAQLTQIKAILFAWGQKVKKITPSNYNGDDVNPADAATSGSWSDRDRMALASYQSWADDTNGEHLRKDGAIDQPSYDSLLAWSNANMGGPPPVVTTPPVNPAPVNPPPVTPPTNVTNPPPLPDPLQTPVAAPITAPKKKDDTALAALVLAMLALV